MDWLSTYELGFDIIRYALSQDVKVFCVDFTGEYRRRLADANPEPVQHGDGESDPDSLAVSGPPVLPEPEKESVSL